MLAYEHMEYTYQKEPYGCGIASVANLLGKDYDSVKKDFEKKFYPVIKYMKVFDIVDYLNGLGLNYKYKFFNQNPKHKNDAKALEFSKKVNTITLTFHNEKYPTGHYLFRNKDGWVDPWVNSPRMDPVSYGIVKKLPGKPWYVIYPVE